MNTEGYNEYRKNNKCRNYIEYRSKLHIFGPATWKVSDCIKHFILCIKQETILVSSSSYVQQYHALQGYLESTQDILDMKYYLQNPLYLYISAFLRYVQEFKIQPNPFNFKIFRILYFPSCTVQYSTVQYSKVQYSTVQYSTVTLENALV